MTVVSRTLENLTGGEIYKHPWVFQTVLRRSGKNPSTTTIAPEPIRVYPVKVGDKSVVSVDLDPGPCLVTYQGVSVLIDVPATGPADLQTLLDAGVSQSGRHELTSNSVALRGRSVDEIEVSGSDLVSFIQGDEVARADLSPLVAFTNEQVEGALVEKAPEVVTEAIAEKELTAERSDSSILFRLGGVALGDPMDFELNVPLANPSGVKTSAYESLPNELVPCDAAGGPFTVTLPESPANFTLVVVKKVDSTTNAVTVQRSGADVFNTSGGPSSAQLVFPGQSMWLQYKSGIWYVLGHGTPLTALDERYYRNAGAISEPNGNVALSFDSVASAVNYWRVVASAGTGAVVLRTAGTATDISAEYRTKGIGGHTFRDGPGSSVFSMTTVASAVNFLRATASAAGSKVILSAQGTDTNIGINLVTKGNEKAYVNDQEIVTRGINVSGHSSTLTPNASTADTWIRTAVAGGCTIAAMTGTPLDGKLYVFRFKDNGSNRSLTWDSFYRAIGVTLPTTTTANKTLYVTGRYNAADNKLDVLDVKQEA